MADQPKASISFTPEDLQNLLRSVLQESNKLNPLDQRKLDDELEREKRRTKRALLEGYNDELRRWNRQQGCTHCTYPMGTIRAGQMAPRGQGEWCTGGQVHTNATITLICNRCQTVWNFKATPNELEFAVNAEHGLLGFEPPPIDRCTNKADFVMKQPVSPFNEVGEVIAKK